MSFRGGRGGGRFGGRGGASSGVPLTEEERNAGSYQFPTATYPEAPVPLQSRASRAERLCAGYFLQFKKQVQEGPFYLGQLSTKSIETGSSSDPKKRTISEIVIEIEDGADNSLNDGIKRYTDRYHKKRKLDGKRAIDEHPYVIELFPKELYEPMGVATKKKGGKGTTARKLELSKFTSELMMTEQQLLAQGIDGEDDAELRKKKLEEKIAELKAEVANGGAADPEDDVEVDVDDDEEDVDDEFDEDDDDDYNAEKYFDDGDGIDDDDGNDEAAY